MTSEPLVQAAISQTEDLGVTIFLTPAGVVTVIPSSIIHSK